MSKLSKITVAMSLALAASTASADFISSAGGNSSSIIFSAIDENTSSANYGATFVYDLALGDAGLNFSSFVNGTQGTKGTLSWDLSQNAAFSAFAADNSQLQWNVLGGESLNSGLTNKTAWGALTTLTTPAVATSVAALTLATGSNSIPIYFTNVNNALGVPNTNVGAIAAGSLTNIANLGSLQNAGSIYANEGGVNSNTIALDLIQNSNTATKASLATPNVVTNLGSFTLSGNTLTFTSASASAVPLPTSIWMFLSGLVGVLGFKRRQNAITTAI
ncbi:hypothetical protein [Methylomonas sp. AM2-LC]|uniref:hypothetical protein n=1 Tax=Methylomonas sp. AM2-LC TaxID=3153301 RepID=UPI003264B715